MMIINNHELAYLKVQADICEYMKNSLQARTDSGKIDLADAADEYEELTKKEKALHESFVRQAHVRHRTAIVGFLTSFARDWDLKSRTPILYG